MKRIWRNKEGVSPVIATILMVAITVVLAAVLYVMVSGYMDQGAGQQISGDLAVDNDESDLASGVGALVLTISSPGEPQISDITVKVFDGATQYTNFTHTWSHLSDSDEDHVKTGDILTVTMDDQFDIDGFKIVMSIEGYSGTIEQNL